MRKVGIITAYDLKNYGNRLQAYAMSEVLRKLNYKPVEVSYSKRIATFLTETIKNNGLILFCYHFLLGILKRNKPGIALKNCKRMNLFLRFSQKTKRDAIRSDSNQFYCYVCGSDQIWNPHLAGQPRFFAAFAPKKKRLSYAASFGVASLPEKNIDRYKKHLTEMNQISVREESGAQLVKQLTGRDAQVTLDPTLMLDNADWKAVSKKPKFDIKGNYILTYFLGEVTQERKNYIQNLADQNNLQIICLNKLEQNDYWYSTGPSEFIWLIENASLVCTDSFHASVFSILMQSPFIVFSRASEYGDMSSRLDTLLGKFNLTGRFFNSIHEGEEFSTDYSHIPEILRSEREESIQFLINALNSVDKKDET